MNSEATKPRLLREVFLLLLGAIISFITALSTTILNNNSEIQRENIKNQKELNRELNIKKYAVADQVATNINSRLYISLELKSNSINGKIDPVTFNKYLAAKEKWNEESLLAEVQINKYFGFKARKEFRTHIQDYAVYLGQDAQNPRLSFDTVRAHYIKYTDAAFKFTNSLYTQIKDE